MTDDARGARMFEVLDLRGLTAKREYVRGLEQRRDPEALSLLVECLCDESGYLRDLAEQVFLKIGDEAAPVLLPWLEQGLWYTRTSAAGVLGRLGHPGAVPGLLRLAEDPNRTVRETATAALVAIGRKRGAARIAWELHRLPPDARQRRLDEVTGRDRALAERLLRLMNSEELMSHADRDALADDGERVRASAGSAEWEKPPGSPSPAPEAHAGHGRDGA